MVSTEEIFQVLQNIPENQHCFECGEKTASWASTNNGIFLCMKCSSIHRNIGTNYSFIRSINLDSWNEKQMNYMRNGGNINLKAFFARYKIAPDAPIDFKFKTKAAQYYRDKLKYIVEGEEFLHEAPSLEEGLEIFDAKQFANNLPNAGSQYEPISVDKTDEKKGFDKFKAQVSTFYDKTTDSAKHTLVSLNAKIKEAHIGNDIKKFGTKVADKSKEYGEMASKKAKEFFNKKKEVKEENKYEEIKDPEMENNNKNENIKNENNENSNMNENNKNNKNNENNENNGPSTEGTVVRAPEKPEKDENINKGNFFSRGFNSMVTSTKTAVSKINQKLEDPEFKKKVSDFKEKVSHTTKEIGDKTSELAKKGYNGIKDGIDKLTDKKKEKTEDEQK